MSRVWLGVTLLLAATSQPVCAEITSVGPGGFSVSHSATVGTGTAESFTVMSSSIHEWWDENHTWSGDAANLYIEGRAGGCFCERLPDGGAAEHLRVVHVMPGQLLRLQGGLGPLQGMGLHGSMTWEVSPLQSGGSTVVWTYSVHGYLENGFESIAAAVDRVLGEQLARLADLLNQH